jgi:acetylornithine deacetylase
MDVRAQLLETIADRQDELLSLLAELVACQSTAGNERPAQEVVIGEFERLGLDPDVWEPDAAALADHPGFFETNSFLEHGYEDRPNVAAVLEGDGEGRSLGFSGHIDVVPVGSFDAWTHDPWSTTVEDGRVYGRGTVDMKGGIAAYLTAVRALEASDVRLSGDLYLQTTIEEEDGGCGGVLSALERGYRPDATIIPEPYGIPNVGIASGGAMYFRIRVPGVSAHAARGHKGVNAYEKSIAVYEALDRLDRRRKGRTSFQPIVNRNPDAAGKETNLEIGLVNGGEWPSTVPGEMTLEGRIGWPPGETRAEVREQVEAAVERAAAADPFLRDTPPEVEWFGWNAAPHEVDRDEPIVEAAKRNATAVTGDEGYFCGGSGGNDQRFYTRYYDLPAIVVGPRGANNHGADEYADVDSLVEVAQALALTAVDWCGVVEAE